MTNQEINEYLARNLFELNTEKPVCINIECSNCKYDICTKDYKYDDCGFKEVCIDYIKNYHLVLEKLIEIKLSIRIFVLDNRVVCELSKSVQMYAGYDDFTTLEVQKISFANTAGEAICSCAVEYFKSKQ